MSKDSQSYANHDEIWLLLPWYLNGSLKAGERERVKAHLRVCLVCRKEMAEQAILAKRLQHQPRVEISAKPSFDRLLARIQSEQPMPPAKPAAKDSWPAGWIARLLDGLEPPRLAAACAVLLLVFLLPVLVLRQQPEPGFHTVADSGSLDRFTPSDLRVIFAERATKRERDKLIGSLPGQIVDGPSPNGIYTIRLLPGGEAGGGLNQVLAQLRNNPSVAFAAPALPQPGRIDGRGE